MEDRTRAAWEALKERLTTDAPSPETFTPNPLDVNLLGSGLSLRGLGHFLGTTRAGVEVAAEPITQTVAELTGQENLRGLASQRVPRYEGVKPLNTEDPAVGKRLALIYGPNLEHWDESPDQAMQSVEGRARVKVLRDLMFADPSYKERRQYWREHIPDEQARLLTMYSEYKESRKADAKGTPETYLGWAATTGAEQMGLGALMEAPAIGKALAAGKPIGQILKAVAAEGTPFGFLRDAGRMTIGAGTVAGNFASALPKTTGALIGGGIGAAENPEHPVLGFIGGTAAGIGVGALAGKYGPAVAERIGDMWLSKAASSLGGKLSKVALWGARQVGTDVPKEFGDAAFSTSQKWLAAVAQNPARWESLLGAGQYPGISMAGTALGSGAVGLMDETDPLEKGLLNAALGLALPVTAKYLTKIPFAGLSRFGTTLAAPVGGAIAGVVGGAGARAAKNAIFGPPEEPPDDTVLGRAFKDALIGSGVATSASVLRGMSGASLPTSALLYDSGGDLNPLGDFLYHVLPLDVTRNMRNPTTGQHLMGDSVGMLQDANENVMGRIHERFSEIAQAVRSQGISPKKLWDEGFQDQLFTAMRKSGAGGMVKPEDVSAVMKLDDDAVALAGPMRKMFDDLFLTKIERGDLTWDDYLHGYVPKMIDQRAFRSEFKGYQRLLETRVVHNLQRKGVFSVPIPDDVHDPAELYRRVREGSIQTEIPTLKDSFTEQDARDLMRVQTVADRMDINRRSAVEILRRGQSLVDEPVSILKEMRKIISGGEGEIPGEPFDPSLERRRKTNIPYEKNPMKVLLRSIVKDARREFYGPLTKPREEPSFSLVSDDLGTPKRVFHGTTTKHVIDPEKTEAGWVVFSEDPAYASTYNKGRRSGANQVIPSYLSYKKLLHLSDPVLPIEEKVAFFKAYVTSLYEHVPDAGKTVAAKKLHSLLTTGKDVNGVSFKERSVLGTLNYILGRSGDGTVEMFGDTAKVLRKALLDSGYDAFSLREPDTDALTYGVLSRDQIHSGFKKPPIPEMKVVAESPLQEAINKIGPEFPQHQKLVADIAKSVMGYPSKMDEVVERLGERWFSNPETAPTSTRIVKDLTYAGALGMKPATGIRNLFSYMLTGSALGKEDAIQGFAQAQKNWEFWRNEALNNKALSNEVLDELEFARDIPAGNLGKISETSRAYAEAMLGIQRFTEEKFRTWTNTAAMLKVLRERSAFNPGYLRDLDAARAREMLAKASTDEDWWNAARYIGKKTTDLVAWKYGPGGTGPALQGRTEKLFTMFSSWPLNYASLLQHWAANGRTQHILNMGVAAAILDKMAIEKFGYTRLTGLSGQGESREQDIFMGLPSGPFDWAMAPLPRALVGVGQAVGGAAMQDEALSREGGAQIKRNLSTIFGLGAVPRAWQGMKDAEEERKRQAYIRLLWGGTPQREEDAE